MPVASWPNFRGEELSSVSQTITFWATSALPPSQQRVRCWSSLAKKQERGSVWP